MSYNGWKNRETWNVSLWLQNDELYYRVACSVSSYPQFIEKMKEIRSFWDDKNQWIDQTPDGVRFDSKKVNLKEMNNLIAELT